MNTPPTSRRRFLHTAAAAGLFSGALPVIGQTASAGKKMKLGLIGCGGRGSQAVENHLDAAKKVGVEIEIHAVCDPQLDRLQGQAKRYGVPQERTFGGFDGYHKLLESGIDLVVLATPPAFRPAHFAI